jgi:hypothetical protein
MKKLALICLIILAAGCSKKEADTKTSATPPAAVTDLGKSPAEQTNVILPLKTGNLWVYQVFALDTIHDRHILLKVDTFEVLKDTVINNETWWDSRQLGHMRGWMINRNDGLWMRMKGDTGEFLWAKYPGLVESEYSGTIMGVPSTSKVMSNSIDVEVQAGKFDCIAYGQYIGKEHILTRYYFCPNKGLIKMEIPDSTHTKIFMGVDLLKMELK